MTVADWNSKIDPLFTLGLLHCAGFVCKIYYKNNVMDSIKKYWFCFSWFWVFTLQGGRGQNRGGGGIRPASGIPAMLEKWFDYFCFFMAGWIGTFITQFICILITQYSIFSNCSSHLNSSSSRHFRVLCRVDLELSTHRATWIFFKPCWNTVSMKLMPTG